MDKWLLLSGEGRCARWEEGSGWIWSGCTKAIAWIGKDVRYARAVSQGGCKWVNERHHMIWRRCMFVWEGMQEACIGESTWEVLRELVRVWRVCKRCVQARVGARKVQWTPGRCMKVCLARTSRRAMRRYVDEEDYPGDLRPYPQGKLQIAIIWLQGPCQLVISTNRLSSIQIAIMWLGGCLGDWNSKDWS